MTFETATLKPRQCFCPYVPRRRHPAEPGQSNDFGIGKKVVQERADVLDSFWSAQVQQDDADAGHTDKSTVEA